RHTSFSRDWSSDVCSSDLLRSPHVEVERSRGAVRRDQARGTQHPASGRHLRLGEVDVDPPIVAKLLLGLLERGARLLQPVLVDRPYPSGGHLGATPILVRDDPRQAVGLPPALPVTTRLLGLLLDQLAM